MIDAKPLCVRFDKIDGWVYNGTRYLSLFRSEKCDLFTIGLNILWE